MLLHTARLLGVGPFDDTALSFVDDVTGAPRLLTVVHGGAGVGKTSVLAAVAATRPGHGVVFARPRAVPGSSDGQLEAPTPAMAVLDYLTGDDDPARPHPLRVVTPSATVPGEDEGEVLRRRREQAFFDRKALEGGFVVVPLSGARWFARSPVHLSAPERTIGRYDVRSPASFDDASRADLARETKQVLTYASVAAARAARSVRENQEAPADRIMRDFDQAVTAAVDTLLAAAGYRYLGADPLTLEPVFEGHGRSGIPFDELPIGARHLTAMAALPVRALHAAYCGLRKDELSPEPVRERQGIVLVDDVDSRLDVVVQRALPTALRAALPRVQWIVTTTSPAVVEGCDAREVVALRRLPEQTSPAVFAGDSSLLH